MAKKAVDDPLPPSVEAFKGHPSSEASAYMWGHILSYSSHLGLYQGGGSVCQGVCPHTAGQDILSEGVENCEAGGGAIQDGQGQTQVGLMTGSNATEEPLDLLPIAIALSGHVIRSGLYIPVLEKLSGIFGLLELI